MLLVNAVKRVDHPKESGEWVEFRLLNWRQLEKARDAKQKQALEKMKGMGADVLRVMKPDKLSPEEARLLEETEARIAAESNGDASGDAAYALESYDLGTLLGLSVVDWSYDGDLDVDKLDEFTATWAGQAALDLVRPETEDELGNV